jgi:DNA-binding Xre family transcriptional regulator
MTANKDLNRLKVVLAEKKKSNLWLSKQLGCAPTTVSKWCTNTSQPTLETLLKITRLLDVDIKDLIRFEELNKES